MEVAKLVLDPHEKLHIRFYNISHAVFKLLLEFIYTGSVSFDPSYVVQLWIATQRSVIQCFIPVFDGALTFPRFNLDRCKCICAYQITRHVNLDNVITVLKVTWAQCDCPLCRYIVV